MKKYYSLFILVIAALNTYGQKIPNEIPWPETVKQNRSDYRVKIYNNSYNFTVLFKNDIEANYFGKIKFDNKRGSYYLSSKEGDIYPTETKSIARINFLDTILGLPFKDKWLFEVVEGELSAYSVYAGNSDLYVNYVRKKGDSTLYLFDEEFLKTNFKSLIADDSLALARLKGSTRQIWNKRHVPYILLVGLLSVSILSPAESALQIASWLSLVPVPILIRVYLPLPNSPVQIIKFYNLNKELKGKKE